MESISPQVAVALAVVLTVVVALVVKFVKRDSENLGISKINGEDLGDSSSVYAYNDRFPQSIVEEDEVESFKESVLQRETPAVYEPPIVSPRKTTAALMRMNKSQIENYARTLDVELDRRMTKSNMIADFLARSD